MTHRNARLTFLARLGLVKEVEQGYSQSEAARRFHVCRSTGAKWVRSYRRYGVAGLEDGCCRPHHSPRLTAPALADRICGLRRSTGWGPHRIGWTLGVARSTVYAVLRRAGLHRRDLLHRTTREIVRFEHTAPGELIHLDIKKVGRIPLGGGKRFLPGFAETGAGPQRGPRPGFEYLHVAVDDYSRYAYVEALSDETGLTSAAFLEHVLREFSRQGILVQRVLTDNGSGYRSKAFQTVATAHQLRLRRTRPYRPQTNGKAEAFNKILQNEWAYARPYQSNRHRLSRLPRFLQYYNHRRPHGGINGATPASRL